jgi:hypothetical protein
VESISFEAIELDAYFLVEGIVAKKLANFCDRIHVEDLRMDEKVPYMA